MCAYTTSNGKLLIGLMLMLNFISPIDESAIPSQGDSVDSGAALDLLLIMASMAAAIYDAVLVAA